MAIQKLDPAPRPWVEKTYDVAGFYISLMIVIAATVPWQAVRTSPLYVAVLFPATLAVYLVMGLLVSPLKKRRIAQNAEKGIVQCSIRPGPKSLPPGYSPPGPSDKRGWISGYAAVDDGSLVFQPMTAFTGYAIGETLTLPNIQPLTGGLRTPTSAPWYLGRGHTVVYVKTGTGVFEVAGSTAGLRAVGIYPSEERLRP